MQVDEKNCRQKGSAPIRQIHRFFRNGFMASDIAEPLFSWDGAPLAEDAQKRMIDLRFEAAGVRIAGGVAGWIERDALIEGPCIAHLRAFSETVVLSSESPLSEVIERLGCSPRIFVTVFGAVGGIITRADLQKAPVRMWLFGLVTLVEENFSRLLKEHFPGDEWHQSLIQASLEGARRLHQERMRRNEHLELVDCLQFSDKGNILFQNEEIRLKLGFESRRRAKEVVHNLERLRNNLAHSQDIVGENLEIIVKLASQMDRVLDASSD